MSLAQRAAQGTAHFAPAFWAPLCLMEPTLVLWPGSAQGRHWGTHSAARCPSASHRPACRGLCLKWDGWHRCPTHMPVSGQVCVQGYTQQAWNTTDPGGDPLASSGNWAALPCLSFCCAWTFAVSHSSSYEEKPTEPPHLSSQLVPNGGDQEHNLEFTEVRGKIWLWMGALFCETISEDSWLSVCLCVQGWHTGPSTRAVPSSTPSLSSCPLAGMHTALRWVGCIPSPWQTCGAVIVYKTWQHGPLHVLFLNPYFSNFFFL